MAGSVRWGAVVTVAVALGGCYLSHERGADGGPLLRDTGPVVRDAGRDAGVTTPPDAGPPCTGPYTRTDVRPGTVRPGRPVEVGPYLVWIPIQSATQVAWYHRGDGSLTFTMIDDVYSGEAHLVATPDGVVAAWEHTASDGRPVGVSVGVLPSTPGPARAVLDVSSTGGTPFLAYGPDRGSALLVYQDAGTRIAQLDVRSGALLRPPAVLDGTTGRLVGAVAGPERYFVATSEEIFAIDPVTLEARVIATAAPGVFFVEFTATDDALVLGGFEGLVLAFDFGGALLAERRLAFVDPGHDVRVAGRGGHVLATSRLPAEALVLDSRLELVYDPGPLDRNPRLAGTSTGFAAVATVSSVSDAVVTFLDECR